MGSILGNVFSASSFVYLCGLIAASLFFVMVGIRELRMDRYEGLMYIGLAVFFIFAHGVFLMANSGSSLNRYWEQINIFEWVALLLGPALILLYLSLGLLSLIKFHLAEALLKIVLGGALIGILYTFGFGWPEAIKALLVIVFGCFWFTIEMNTAGEME